MLESYGPENVTSNYNLNEICEVTIGSRQDVTLYEKDSPIIL